MHTRRKVPFEYNSKQEFQEKLVEWVGDVLYDYLPEHGYEVRDEQIYTAFQIADSICGKKPHLAEAGLGTGKTFAYLLSAISYARFTGKPVVVASATTALQEQLAGESGDIRKLSEVFGLDIDVRMAKDPSQYVCDIKANEYIHTLCEKEEEVVQWLNTTRVGERSEIPTISDREWNRVKWDDSLNCNVCSVRGYCLMVKAREHYRQTKDLLIVDHATFFHDLWSRDEHIANGETPILPSYSAVIFDEGHKVLLPAMVEAGKCINKGEISMMISDLEELQGVREELLKKNELVKKGAYIFFKNLRESIEVVPGEERFNIRKNPSLLKAAATFRKTLDYLLLEMQIEQGLYTEALSATQIQAYENQIEKAMWALDKFCKDENNEMVSWLEKKDVSFWVVPRNIGEKLNKHLFNKEIPSIFTSATLSNKGNFDYFCRKLGLKAPTTSTIGSPFDLENQVKVYIPETKNKVETLIKLLKDNGGRALVLTSSLIEVKRIRKELEGTALPFEMIWEDQGERGYLVRKFREEETSVLIGTNFWEGIDIPGEALTLVVIWDLPLNVKDPLVEIQRKDAIEKKCDPVATVDYPEMALRLKQGCGRLIRTEEDHGSIVILDSVIGRPWEGYVRGALPAKAKVYVSEIPKLKELIKK